MPSSLEEFDKISKKETTKSELLKSVGDVFTLGMEEFSRTLGKNFSPPIKGQGQITREMDQRENTVITNRGSA